MKPKLRLPRILLTLATTVWCHTAVQAASPDLSRVLAKLRNQSEGSWAKLNNNSFQDALTPYALRAQSAPAYRNPLGIIYPWASYAWDSNRAQLLIYGGGHGNYGGNDVYRWVAASQRWERASLPSNIKQVPGSHAMLPLDGPLNAPVSSHTYDGSVYLAVSDRYWVFGQGVFPDTGPHKRLDDQSRWVYTGPYLFDPARADPNKVGGTDGSGVDPTTPGGRMWNNRDLWSVMKAKGQVFPDRQGCATTAAAVEEGKDVVYISSAYSGGPKHFLFRHTLPNLEHAGQDTWEVVGVPGVNVGCHTVGAIDHHNRFYIRTGGKEETSTSPAFIYWDLAKSGPLNRSRGVTRAQLQGDPAFRMQEHFGMDYDPQRQRMLLWAGDQEVWSLRVDPSGKLWEVTRAASAAPQGAPGLCGTGVMGKWNYIPNLDVFIGLEDDGDIWAYKPEGWRDPASRR